jgi:hypothetical protein
MSIPTAAVIIIDILCPDGKQEELKRTGGGDVKWWKNQEEELTQLNCYDINAFTVVSEMHYVPSRSQSSPGNRPSSAIQ